MIKYLYMMKNFLKSFFCVNLAVIIVGVMPGNVYALTDAELEMFAQNNILFYDPGNTMCVDDVDGSFSMEQNASIVIGMLMAAGYTHESALAVAGNIKGESNFNPRVIEGGKNVEDGWRAWDNGAKTFKGGFGLVQWTTAGRVQRLQEYADSQNLWVGSLRAQIGFMIEELSGNFGPDRMNGMGFEEATFLIYRRYETPGSSFWTIHDGKYYNDYAPGSFSELSETKTPAAYKAFYKRFNAAKNLASLTPAQLSASCSYGGSSESGGALGGGGANVEASILAAVSMSWPNDDGTCNNDGKMIEWKKNKKACYDDIKPAYRQGMVSVLGSEPSKNGGCPEKGALGYYQDCGHFVATAIIYSGLDKDLPRGGTARLLEYFTGKGSKKWQEIKNIGNTTNLQAGDVFIVRYKDGDKSKGHIMMYTGSYSKFGDLASASWCTRTANMGKVDFSLRGHSYRIFRYVGGE